MLNTLDTELNCPSNPLAGKVILIYIRLPRGCINVSQSLPFPLTNHQVSDGLEQYVTGSPSLPAPPRRPAPPPRPLPPRKSPPERSLRWAEVGGLAQKDAWGSSGREDSREVILSVRLPLRSRLPLPDLGLLDSVPRLIYSVHSSVVSVV